MFRQGEADMTVRTDSYGADEWAAPFRAWFEGILKKNGWTREHFGEGAISNLSLAFEEGWKAREAQQFGPSRDRYGSGPGSTHWDECWRAHHGCAIAKIERLLKQDDATPSSPIPDRQAP